MAIKHTYVPNSLMSIVLQRKKMKKGRKDKKERQKTRLTCKFGFIQKKLNIFFILKNICLAPDSYLDQA